MEKAKYLGACSVDWKHTDLFYEYRGYEYCVTKHNNGYMDKSLREQHEEEQRKIDELIEEKNKPIESSANNIAWEAFDKLYDYFETGIWED